MLVLQYLQQSNATVDAKYLLICWIAYLLKSARVKSNNIVLILINIEKAISAQFTDRG